MSINIYLHLVYVQYSGPCMDQGVRHVVFRPAKTRPFDNTEHMHDYIGYSIYSTCTCVSLMNTERKLKVLQCSTQEILPYCIQVIIRTLKVSGLTYTYTVHSLDVRNFCPLENVLG